MNEARRFCSRLRERDKHALKALRNALVASGGAVGEAALLVGLAGASSVWRVAYAVPEVMTLIVKHGRRPWELKKGVTRGGKA